MRKFRLVQYVGIIIVAMLLAGCKYSDHYLTRHPSTLKSVLLVCQAMKTSANSNEQCQSAEKIYYQLLDFSRQLANQPEVFGNTVLHDQMKLSQIHSQIDQLTAQKLTPKKKKQLSDLQKNDKALKHQIDVKLAVIAQMEGI